MSLIEDRAWRDQLVRATTSFELVVCEPDAQTRASICELVDQRSNLHVLSACSNGVQALELIVRSQAAALIIASETPGMSAVDIILEITSRRPEVPIVLVSHDRDARQVARRLGLFGGIYRYKFAELAPLLDRLAEYLHDPDRHKLDRRAGTDRRGRQVWATVTRQRRDGGERRARDLPTDVWPMNR